MAHEFLFAITVFTFVCAFWLVIFFGFDAEILNGYFKKKLQKRFNKDEL